MTALLRLHEDLFARLESLAPAVLPTLARLVFAGVLTGYFWKSAQTKIGDGVFGFLTIDFGAYTQIFPRKFEALGYDPSGFGLLDKLVILAGTYAEFVLPLLIVVGLFTRLAALGMIGFIVVQSLTDIIGHNADASTIGAWFDRHSNALILDQRAFWVFLLLFLVLRGGGPLALDRLVFRQAVSG